MPSDKVFGVVVTYQPDIKRLAALFSALHTQVEATVVVDNASSESFRVWLADHNPDYLEAILLEENLGIATAQNIGVGWAKGYGATHILLLDQDSVPSPDMVDRLLNVLHTYAAAGRKVAAVGPRILDGRRSDLRSFTQVKTLRGRRDLCHDDQAVVPVDYLIASGCLIPVSVFDLIGSMREEFFIDYVDIEWGFRAKCRGFELLGVCAARMSHELGGEPIHFFGRTFPIRVPLRHYYMFRNAIWLYSRLPVPLRWKVADAWRLFMKYGFYIFFGKSRIAQLQMMTLGIWHGLRGRLGRLNEK